MTDYEISSDFSGSYFLPHLKIPSGLEMAAILNRLILRENEEKLHFSQTHKIQMAITQARIGIF